MEHFMPAAAVILDGIIGDPRSKFHPVVLIGKLIAFLENMLLHANDSRHQKIAGGALLVFLVLAASYSISWLFIKLLSALQPSAAFFGGALLLSFTISPRSLAAAGREIKNYLLSGNLAQARCKVGWIVGRDTKALSIGEVTRATVETIAENIVDGVVSPLFYFIIGGVPLAFLYRAVNTLDSMVGYRNDKYRDFGMIAARVDDIFNFIPARLTAILLVAAAFLLRYDAKSALRSIVRDAGKHPSPNSGMAEAAVAGALGIQLGGLNFYGGVPSLRAHMGQPRKELAPIHIKQTTYLMYAATALFLAGAIWI
ncbi:MAG: adenosylcobinamide-phosphate synthase CbiB [Veillonellales bacterium]